MEPVPVEYGSQPVSIGKTDSFGGTQPPLNFQPQLQMPQQQPPPMMAPVQFQGPMIQPGQVGVNMQRSNSLQMQPSNSLGGVQGGGGTNLVVNLIQQPHELQPQPQQQQPQPQQHLQQQPQHSQVQYVQQPVQFIQQPQPILQPVIVQQPVQYVQVQSPIQSVKQPVRRKKQDPVERKAKSAVMSAGLCFIAVSVINSCLIYCAIMFGMIPWCNYPFDIAVVCICLLACIPIAQFQTRVQKLLGSSSAYFTFVFIGFGLHIFIMVCECINLCLSLCPYLFYVIDLCLTMVLMLQFCYGIFIAVIGLF